jgi:MarR family transcriptional regulator, organic hydroperoxide resistance regulator
MSRARSEGGYLVAKAHQIGGRVFARLLKESAGSAINPAQGRLLFALWKAKEGMSMTALSVETALEPSTLTSMVDRLEAAGFVRRLPSGEDRRAFLVECTPSGRRIEKDYRAVSERMIEIYYKGMGSGEVKAFESSLRKVVENLQEAEEEPLR